MKVPKNKKHEKFDYENYANPVAVLWDEIRAMIDPIELDAYKNGVKHQLIPGVRFRHALREMYMKIRELINVSIQVDKETKAARLAVKPKGRKPGKKDI